MDILADGYPVSAQIDCTTGAAIGPPVGTKSDDGLVFVDGLYKYLWKTDRAWVGTCRELRVLLVDGTLHTANFRFK